MRTTRTGTILATTVMAATLTACAGEASGTASDGASPSTAPRSDAPEASRAPSPTASASAEPEPSEAARPLTIAWKAARPFDGQPAELIVDGDTWVAVGWASERGPAAWTSADAETWTRAEVPDPQPDDTFRGSGLGPTIRLGDSLLSFGTFIGCCDGREVLGWRSGDGTSWEVIQSDSPLFDTGYLVRALAVEDQTLVAVEIQYGEFAGRIWTWTPETSWVETTPDSGSGQTSGMQPNDVVRSDGRFVAVGTRADDETRTTWHGASWVSADGQSWQESPAADALAGVRLVSVEALDGGGYAAIGYADSPTPGEPVVPIAFASADGIGWTPVEGAFGDARWLPYQLVATDSGLVAFGSSVDGTVVWTSPDGRAWTDGGVLDFEYQAAAAHGDTIAVFTADFLGDTGWRLNVGTIGGP